MGSNKRDKVEAERLHYIFECCCRRNRCCLGFLLLAHARRQDQTREVFLAMQGREHFSFKALLFSRELVAFLGVYSAFS